MMAEIDRKQIEKYFNPFPQWALLFLIAGVPLLLVYGIGLIPLGIGGLAIFLWMTGQPTDEEMDRWFQQEVETLKARALQKVGFDASEAVGEPVPVSGPRVINTAGVPFQIRSGKDGTIRYNPIDLCILNFGQNQLLSYQCCYDRFTGNYLQETTDEYFYRDVVSVSTKTDSSSKDVVIGKKQVERILLKSSEEFVLTTSGGTSIKIFLKDDGLLGLKSTKNGILPTTQAEKAVATVRRMLRDKKT